MEINQGLSNKKKDASVGVWAVAGSVFVSSQWLAVCLLEIALFQVDSSAIKAQVGHLLSKKRKTSLQGSYYIHKLEVAVESRRIIYGLMKFWKIISLS